MQIRLKILTGSDDMMDTKLNFTGVGLSSKIEMNFITIIKQLAVV